MSKQPSNSIHALFASPILGAVADGVVLFESIKAVLRSISVLSTNLLVVIIILLSIVLIILGPGVWL